MKAYVTDSIHQRDVSDWTTIEYDGTESDLFKQVGQMLLTCKVPAKIVVNAQNGQAVLDVKERGTWTDDKGNVHPSIHVTGSNNISTKPSDYKNVILTCVHPESNNYKAYELAPDNVARNIIARYESIDKFFAGQARTVKTPYESWMYWILYYEKLSKGYVDQSSLIVDRKPLSTKKKEVKEPNTDNASLYKLLMNYANKVVNDTFVNRNLITPDMVKKAKAILKEMTKRKTVNGFNSQLQKLIAICPRKRDWMSGDKVKDFLANCVGDFERILEREENLIMAMDAVAYNDYEEVVSESFEQFNIEVFKATDKQKDEVMGYLSPSLRPRVTQIYRVKPKEQEKKFSDYCKKHNITQIKKLWHGSRNENWASIIRTSLNLSHGCANGRMFGDGEYFATSADKSYNYTSCRGTTWARGQSNTGFMGLFATAYGNPYYVKGYGAQHYSQASINRLGYDCVHATTSNTGLRADEIIFYDENAMCLNYIVQFAV